MADPYDEYDEEADAEDTAEMMSDIRERVVSHMQSERPFRFLLDTYRVELVENMFWESVLDSMMSNVNYGLRKSDQTERIRRANNDYESRRKLLDAILCKDVKTFRLFILSLARETANPEIARRIAEDADGKLNLEPPLLPEVERIMDPGFSRTTSSASGGTATGPTSAPGTSSLSEAGLTYMPRMDAQSLHGGGGAASSSVDQWVGNVSTTTTTSAEESQESIEHRLGAQLSSYYNATSHNSSAVDPYSNPDVTTTVALDESDALATRKLVTYASDESALTDSFVEGAGFELNKTSTPRHAGAADTSGQDRQPFAANGEFAEGAGSGTAIDGHQQPLEDEYGDVRDHSREEFTLEISPPSSSVSDVQRRREAEFASGVPWYASRGFPGAALCALGLACLLIVPSDRAQHVVLLTALGVGCSLAYQYSP